GLKPGWIARFAERVAETGAVVPFKCLLRADLVDAETAAALRRAGCRTVWIGAESGAQKVLDAMEKGTTVAQIGEATARLRAAGIEVGYFLQFGYPGEGWDEIQATLRMVRAFRPDQIGVSVAYPLPGTKFYERVQAELGAQRNWIDSDDLAMLYAGPYPPGFYRALHRLVPKEFRMRRNLDRAAAALRRPWELRPRHARRIASGLFHLATLPAQRRRLARLADPRPPRAAGRPAPST